MKLDLRQLKARLMASRAYLPAVALSSVIAYKAIKTILAKTGHPAVPLDDAFIHFQYARNLASGHFFTYAPGDSFSAGATSLLWPLLLAPFHLVGFRDLSIIWIAWILGFAAHAALTVEIYRLTSKLTGSATAMGAAAMTALFGPMVWFAASGMEAVPLSWMIARTARLAAEWAEANDDQRSRRMAIQLAVFGFLCPLMRPEGALGSLMALAALAVVRPAKTSHKWKGRLLALVPLAGTMVLPLIYLVFTGSTTSNTAVVKWLPLSPYYPTLSLVWVPVQQHIALFFSTLLNGEQWSALFLPKQGATYAIACLVAIPVLGWRSGKYWRAGLVLLFALAILIPCTYMSFLWNRLRYLWPFAPAWFVGVACLARLIGEAASQVRPRWIEVAPVVSGAVAGLLTSFLGWSMDDLAQSASAIDRQQVKLGRWANENLPADAVIGVNDTGAIAYMSNRKTFDVVGLTTSGESKYWAAGAGSRFEHYERMSQTHPDRLPTHFMVYPEWMACKPVLGPEIYEAAVYDQSILGGARMVVYPLRKDLLGSGARPRMEAFPERLVDELDIADLESETEHAYEYLQPGTAEASNRVYTDLGLSDDEEDPTKEWADGGRFERLRDVFTAKLPSGGPVRGMGRWVGPQNAISVIEVKVEGRLLATVSLSPSRATEAEFVIPAELVKPQTRVEVTCIGNAGFGSLHYWFGAK